MKLFLESITTRIAVWMIVIASVPLFLIAYTLHYQKKDEITAQHLSNLQVVFNQTIEKSRRISIISSSFYKILRQCRV